MKFFNDKSYKPFNKFLSVLSDKIVANPWWFEKSPRFSNFTKHSLTWDDLGFKINGVHDRFKIIKGGI